jgi:endonuclease/exonuclease/phosphatase family metal-dependent hydrolase
MVAHLMINITTANITHGMSFQPALDQGTESNLNILGSQLSADVVCLQEVDSFHHRSDELDQTTLIKNAGGFAEARFAASLYGQPGPGRDWRKSSVADFESEESFENGYGISILTRFPVIRWERLEMRGSRFSLPIPIRQGNRTLMVPIPDEPRIALAVECETPLGKLMFINTHLSFIPPTAMKQLAALTKWAHSLGSEFVIAGDLNLPRRLVNRITGLNNAVDFKTYPAMSPRAHIDHVLFGEQLTNRETHSRWLQAGDHLSVNSQLHRP